MALLWYSNDDDPKAWGHALSQQIPDLDFRIYPDTGPVDEIDTALVWLPPKGLLAGLPNLRAIFSLAAGVDAMLLDPTLPDLPLCRMIDPSLTHGMSEYVLFNILKYHRDMHLYSRQQRAARWELHLPVPPFERRIGIMGLGELGTAAAKTLISNGFKVRGWSRSAKQIDGVEVFAGKESLNAFLKETQYLVCLLPLTDETADILNADLFARLPKGAFLIHVGRGAQLVPEDLLAALDQGTLAGATLDVTPKEPLETHSRLWRHPLIDITPHAASYTHPSTGAANIAQNLKRLAAGEPLLGVVDRKKGY